MTKYRVVLYNMIHQEIYVDAMDEEDATTTAWQRPLSIDLPEGFSLSDPSAWEVYDVEGVE